MGGWLDEWLDINNNLTKGYVMLYVNRIQGRYEGKGREGVVASTPGM